MIEEEDDGLEDIRERERQRDAHYDEVLHKRYDDEINVDMQRIKMLNMQRIKMLNMQRIKMLSGAMDMILNALERGRK